MAVAAYLKIEDVEGESNEHLHPRWIEVLSHSFGGHTEGAGDIGSALLGGKANFQDFHFTKRCDASTPKLMEACATAKNFKFADLECLRTAGDKTTYLKIHFDHLIISSYQTSGACGDAGVPTESISLNFVKFQIIYSPLDQDGRPSGHVPVTYDLKQQTAL